MERPSGGTGELFVQRLQPGVRRAKLTHALRNYGKGGMVEQMTMRELAEYQQQLMRRFRAVDGRED